MWRMVLTLEVSFLHYSPSWPWEPHCCASLLDYTHPYRSGAKHTYPCAGETSVYASRQRLQQLARTSVKTVLLIVVVEVGAHIELPP